MTRTAARFALAACLCLLAGLPAQAQLFRAYLSSAGNDANPCTLPAPCRLLPAALAAVASGGEIWMLDSANYNTGPVTIGKSVSILAIPGAVGSVVALGGPALVISAAGLKVGLRNLVIVPFPGSGGTFGVYMTGASSVSIDGTFFADITSDAVRVEGAGQVTITNSVIRGNGGYGVHLRDGALGDISSTKILNGGVVANTLTASTTTLTISDSIITGSESGAFAFAGVNAGAVSRIFLTRCSVQQITYAALDSETSGAGSAIITVSASMITNNANGYVQAGAGSVIRTLGNNHISDNAGNIGTLTPAALQ
jgi:hypothetical protein